MLDQVRVEVGVGDRWVSGGRGGMEVRRDKVDEAHVSPEPSPLILCKGRIEARVLL